MTSKNCVASDAFVRRMAHQWELKFHLQANQGLRTDWQIFADAIDYYLRHPDDQFHVLAPKTGTGKTMGLALYLAMLSDLNLGRPEGRTGALVVVRTRKQCDEIVTDINHFAGGRSVAIASHGNNDVEVRDCSEYDVLVVTHEAYRLALHAKHDGSNTRWSALVERHGDLCFIDEAPHVLVRKNTVHLDVLRTLLAWCNQETRKRHKEFVGALQLCVELLEQKERAGTTEADLLWEGAEDCPITCPSPLQFDDLRRELLCKGAASLSEWLDDDTDLSMRLGSKVHDVLRICQALFSTWALFQKSGDRFELSSWELPLPSGIGGHFVLDATAPLDPFWQLFGDKVHVFRHWTKSRIYDAATLHILRKNGSGKSAFIDNAERLLPSHIDDLARRHPSSLSVLCVPNDVVPLTSGLIPDNLQCGTMHWGAIAGRNDFSEHEVIGLLSLPYRSQADYLLWYLASCRDGERRQRLGDATEGVANISARHVASEVIQAINRIRCRRPIDERGGCLPCDIYLLLPKGPKGDDMLELIGSQLPGARTKDWKLEPAEGVGRVRAGTFQEKFLDTVLSFPTLRTTTKELRELMQWPSGQLKEIHEVLKDATHDLSLALREGGVSFWHNGGRGRASTWHLVKT